MRFFHKSKNGQSGSGELRRFAGILLPFWTDRKTAFVSWLMLLLSVALVYFNTKLNVDITRLSGDFTNSMVKFNKPQIYSDLWRYAEYFAIWTPVAVMGTFVQQRLTIRWRVWLTNWLLTKWLANRNFYRINAEARVDNPDERLHEDTDAFTANLLNQVMNILSSLITLFQFAVVLYTISDELWHVVLVYALAGTVVTVLYGRRLVGLIFNQRHREADFRYGLVHFRKNVESIAFYQGEEQEGSQIRRRLTLAADNFLRLIARQRNLAFFTGAVNNIVTVLPYVVLLGAYLSRKVTYGDLTEAAIAFGQVLAALSLVVSSFAGNSLASSTPSSSDISSLIAVARRLGTFNQELDATPAEGQQLITTVTGDMLSLQNLTLLAPGATKPLIENLCVTVEPGQGLLIVGPSGVGKSSLLRAFAGLWLHGSGVIERPQLPELMFLPQSPYMSLGSLRDQLLYPRVSSNCSDADLHAALAEVGLERLLFDADGEPRPDALDFTLDWSACLSPGQQQRLAFARGVLIHQSRFLFLDEATSGLDVGNEARLYRLLASAGSTFVSVGHRPSLAQYHSNILWLTGNGQWKIVSPADYLAQVVEQPAAQEA